MIELDKEREKLLKKGIWLTKDNRQVPVAQMENSHLRNTLRMLKRAGNKYLMTAGLEMACGLQPRGDMAQMAFDSELSAIAEAEWDEAYPDSVRILIEEAEKRGLEWWK